MFSPALPRALNALFDLAWLWGDHELDLTPASRPYQFTRQGSRTVPREAIGRLIKITKSTYEPHPSKPRSPRAELKFTFGKKQKVDEIELDNLFTDLQGVLQKHPLVPAANIDTLVSEWINDLLFLAGKITEEELQEAMQAFETQGAEPAAVAAAEEDDADKDDEDDEE